MNEVLISIITPTHDLDLDTLKRTRDSVLEATRNLSSFEWVLILHNMAGMTVEEMGHTLGDNPNFHIYEKHDGTHSPSAPRNEGIRKSMGKYLYFLDDDDVCEPGFFEKALDKMERESIDILQARTEAVRGSEDIMMVPTDFLFPYTKDGYILPDDKDIRGRLLYGSGNFLATKIFPGNLIRDNHILFNEEVTLTEDVLFEVECYGKADKICAMSSLKGYSYVQRGDSLLQRLMKEDSFDDLEYLKPLDLIVDLSVKNNISPSCHIWDMLGMFGVMFAKENISADKKRHLFSHSQGYGPYLDFEFPKWISSKRARREYIYDRKLTESEVAGWLKLYPGCSLCSKDISKLSEAKQLSFIKGFWRAFPDESHMLNVALLGLGENKTMLLCDVSRQLPGYEGLLQYFAKML